MESQRQAILEERRLERESRLKFNAAAKIQTEAKQQYMNDQIAMLQEDLAEAQRQEAILEKAHKQVRMCNPGNKINGSRGKRLCQESHQ